MSSADEDLNLREIPSSLPFSSEEGAGTREAGEERQERMGASARSGEASSTGERRDGWKGIEVRRGEGMLGRLPGDPFDREAEVGEGEGEAEEEEGAER